MSSDSINEKAARLLAALNGLGHLALGHPLEGMRESQGDAKVRAQFHEDATLVLELLEGESGSIAPATRRPEECKSALARFRELITTLDFDDAASMALLRTHARQALEAFMGVPLPETLPE